jgi:hypothetical protein
MRRVILVLVQVGLAVMAGYWGGQRALQQAAPADATSAIPGPAAPRASTPSLAPASP